MADSLNMNGLSLNDSKHAPSGSMPRTYIPPHLRGQPAPRGPIVGMDGAGPGPTPAAANQGLNGGAWANNA